MFLRDFLLLTTDPQSKKQCLLYKKELEKSLPIPEDLKKRMKYGITRIRKEYYVLVRYKSCDEIANNYVEYICDNQPSLPGA